MTLSLKNDPSRAGGGFALLEGAGLADVTAIAIEDAGNAGIYFGEDGKPGKVPFAFPVEATPSGALSLGPHIVDFVPTDMRVALHAQDGRTLGEVFWADIIPSRRPRSVTSRQVFDDRRRKAAEEAAAEAAKSAAAATEAKRIEDDAAAQRQKEEDEREAARREQEDRERLKREQEARAERDRAQQRVDPPPQKKRRTGLYALLALLLVAAVGAGWLATNPTMLDRLRRTAQVTPPPSPPHVEPAPPPAPTPVTPPQPPPQPAPQPPAPVPVDCTRAFSDKLDGLPRLSDPDKVELGEQALHDGCGGEAFRAFDAADKSTNEAAAWYVARFYDPNETNPVVRAAAQVHADYAAAYYRLWRDRSPRQAAALARICRADREAGASLRRSCGG